VVKAVVKCNLGVLFYGRSNPEIAHVPRASGVSVLLGSDTGTALPNHPRYQLRYTRLFGFSILAQTLRKAKSFPSMVGSDLEAVPSKHESI